MKKLGVVILLLLYLAVWTRQAGKTRWADYYLSPAPPAPVLKIASGYARQTTAFLLFINVAVFTGGPLRGIEKTSYVDNLAQNFDVMSELYPAFVDQYHYCQSFLAPIAPRGTQHANKVLARGVAELPDVMYLPFFRAFNHYYYLHDYPASAELFFALSKHPGAPPWFGHLAGILMGRGGNLTAGRTMLQAMLETEHDEFAKKRYRLAITNFDKALKVQAALNRYQETYGNDVDLLHKLIPEFLDSLPNFSDDFKLLWEPPILRLERM